MGYVKLQIQVARSATVRVMSVPELTLERMTMTDSAATTVARRAAGAAPVNLDRIASLAEAWEMCGYLAQSDIVPMSLRNKPANILLVYLTGRELDLSFAQALRTIYVPTGGQPQLRGSLLLALLRKAGHDYEWEYSSDGDTCAVTITRGDNGKSYSASFSLDDALTAGLVKKAANGDIVALSSQNRPLPWMQYRQDLLFWRATARAANRAAPEVMLGFEIMGHGGPERDTVDLQPAPASPVAAAEEDGKPAAAEGDAAAAELAALDARSAGAAVPAGPPGEEAPSTAPPPADISPVEQAALNDPAVRAAVAAARSSPSRLPAGERRANSKALQAVAERFTELGWTWDTRKADILGACTLYSKRLITKPTGLTAKDATGLAVALSAILRKNEPDHYLVALSDQMDQWEEDWKDADLESYERVYLRLPHDGAADGD